MQNRKAPIIPFAIVVVALGGMAIWNAGANKGSKDAEAQPKDEEVSTKGVSDADRENAKKELEDSFTNKPQEQRKTEAGKKLIAEDAGPGQGALMAQEPTILLPKFSKYSPKPNDSSTATHWYDEESPVGENS